MRRACRTRWPSSATGNCPACIKGIVVAEVSPESVVGGPLALVENGDRITIDVAARTLTLNVPEDVLAQRAARWTPPPITETGYLAQYAQLVQPLSKGAVLGERRF